MEPKFWIKLKSMDLTNLTIWSNYSSYSEPARRRVEHEGKDLERRANRDKKEKWEKNEQNGVCWPVVQSRNQIWKKKPKLKAQKRTQVE